jgi:MSHA biogenesis protein MshN
MSVINQMLQDLEKRRAGATEGAAMPNQVRPLPAAPATVGKSLFIGVGVAAIVILVVVASWWLKSSPAVSPPALQSKPPVVSAPSALETPPVPLRTPATPPHPAVAAAKTADERTAYVEKKQAQLPPGVSARAADKSAAPAPVPAVTATATAAPPAAVEPAPRLRTDFAPGSINKQPRPDSPRERADVEYRRATAALSQGRADEAEEALRAALAEDPTYDGARQTLVGMMVEQKRVDEAKKLLQDYLVSRPNHLGFAMLLARLQLDRGDGTGAVTTISRTLPYAGDNADFLGFAAALLQRAGRHPEAADQYRAALRVKPDAGVWWMGLGISLQASEHPSDAVDAYKRALSTSSLSPELQAFVEQKIKQLTP